MRISDWISDVCSSDLHPRSPDGRSVVRRQEAPASTTRPLVTPLSPSVVFRAADADALDAVYEGRAEGFSYAREGHPNASLLADKQSGRASCRERVCLHV